MLRVHRDERGFTLIEVLVSTGILVIFMASVAGAYLAQEKAMKVEEEVTDMQQNGRIVMDYIEASLKNAGFGIVGGTRATRTGPLEYGIRVPDTLLGLPNSNQYYNTKGVFAVNDAPVSNEITNPTFIPGSEQPANPTVSDVLVTIAGGLPLARLANDAGKERGGSFIFQYCSSSEGNIFKRGDLIIVTNARNSALYRITQNPVLSGTSSAFCRGKYYTLTCQSSDRINNTSTKLRHRDDSSSYFLFKQGQALIMKAYVTTFRMIDSAVDTTYWDPQDPRPVLMVDTHNPSASNPMVFDPAVPLAENIGTLQLSFGFWVPTGGNQIPDMYVYPNPSHGNKLLVDDYNFTTIDSAGNARVIKYSILVKNEKSDYQKEGPSGGTAISGLSESVVISSGAKIGSYTLSDKKPGYRWRLFEGMRTLRNIYGLKDDYNDK